MSNAFQRCRDGFRFRFDELKEILKTPFDYARVVLAIGNQLDISKIKRFDWLPRRTKLDITEAVTYKNAEHKLKSEHWQ